MVHPAVPTVPEQPHPGRIAVLVATLATLAVVLLGAVALPARAATVPDNAVGGALGGSLNSNVGSGVGTGVAAQPTASAQDGSSGALLFGGFCLAVIVATAGGVLFYTVRTRRTV
jgi:hypothetical protein